MTALSVEADDGETERYGKSVSDLQSNIAFGESKITGTSKYVTGYTGYSGDVAEQSGNYLAFTLETEDGATVKVSWDGVNWADATTDGYAVGRLNGHEKLYIKASASGKIDNLMVLSLEDLVLEED